MKANFCKNIIRVVAILFAITLFASCSKRTDNLIVGVWKVEDVEQPTFPEDATWTFYDDGRLDVYNDINGVPGKITTFEWDAFSRSLVTPYIELNGNADLDHINPKAGMNGKWRVEKLNKEILVLNRVEFLDGNVTGAFLRREFTRQ